MGVTNPTATPMFSGMMMPFAGPTAPSGWLLCFGQAISRADYPNLFTTIGTVHGVGDGTTTFNLPDLRGRIPVGKDDMGGSDAGRAGGVLSSTTLGAVGGDESHIHTTGDHALTSGENGPHTHGVPIYAGGSGATPRIGFAWIDSAPVATVSANSSGSGTAHNHGNTDTVTNIQPSAILNYIIKT